MLLPQSASLSMTNFPLLRIPRETKFYDIAALLCGWSEASPERVIQKRRKTMTKQNQQAAETSSIDYIAYKVEKNGKNTYWNRVGVAFKPHGDGEGFTVKFADGIAVMGEVVFRKPKPADEQATEGEQVEATE